MQTFHHPERSCVACRAKRDKSELLRVVRSPQGAVSLDLSGRAPGRGAYVCQSAACLESALTTKKLARALRVDLNDETGADLCLAFAECEGVETCGRN